MEKKDDAYLFVAEWFDPMPQLKRRYLLKYYPDQHAVEMIDLKSQKMFLKKSPCPPEVSKEDFLVGAKVLLYSRMLELVDYADGKTRQKLHFQEEKSMVLIPAGLYAKWGEIITALNNDMYLIEIRSLMIPDDMVETICRILDKPYNSSLSTGVSLMAVFNAEGGYNKMKSIIEKISEGVLFTGELAQTNDLYQLFTKSRDSNQIFDTSTLDNCTCCVVKPHAMKARLTGDIMEEIIAQGYEISAVTSMHFNQIQAEEFYEVYKDVVPEYVDHVAQLYSGPCVAFEIRAENAVDIFRQTVGPWDTGMAQELRPDTIRGKFGSDNIRNAVHCTDLPTDGAMECEYCFKIMNDM